MTEPLHTLHQLELIPPPHETLPITLSSGKTEPRPDNVHNDLEGGNVVGGDPFDRWSEMMLEREVLSQDSVYQYKTMWRAWCDWLKLRSRPWYTVDGPLVETFLLGAAPGQGGRRKALNADRMSAYTRQRYWRILFDVYAKAVRDGTIAISPMLDVPPQLRPKVLKIDRSLQTLPPHVFKRLQDPRVIESIIPVEAPADWWHLRDRAILALLVDTGITTSELIALRGAHLVLAEQTFSLSQKEPAQLAIKVVGSSKCGDRILPISYTTMQILFKWLRWRKVLLREHVARSGALAPSRDPLITLDSQWPLFIARYMRGQPEGSPIDATSLYLYTSKALKRLFQDSVLNSNVVDVTTPHQAMGPAIIRHTVICQWMITFGPEETAIRAGLRRIELLRSYSEHIESLP